MSTTDPVLPASADATEAMVADSSSYELLKKRLAAQGETLLQKTLALNEARLAEFGRSEQALIQRATARTENNCVARDIVRIGGHLLFGYNVFIGLKKETAVGDVFALYRLSEQAGGELEALPLAGTFLDDSRFLADFRELYAYYKQASLLQLRVTQDKLLAAFQIGQQLHDRRVFRWNLAADGSVTYQDNRGERDMALPSCHDFEWIPVTREDLVEGRHPHANILDTVFVETIGGDLTVKVENNTESGLGIYSEPVEDKNQSLTDAEIAYARLGLLILLKVRPYREQQTRYLVFNSRTRQVDRIDAIGVSCVQLPEDQGIIFPGGYYLQSGEHKRFDLPEPMLASLRYKRLFRSPNGEDVLYVFYQPESGHYALFSYNLIEKTLSAPILGNGYARFPDGRILVFSVDGSEPTRVHPMQLWQTPFTNEDFARQAENRGFFGRIGNAALVRGIAELMGIARAVREQVPSRVAYEDMIRQCARVLDAYFWLSEGEAGQLASEVKAISDGARSTLAEFEKVDSIRRETAKALAQAESEQKHLLAEVSGLLWHTPDDFIKALGRLRERRGQLHLLKELRYADLPRIEVMDAELAAEQQRIGERALQFLAEAQAFDSYRQKLDQVAAQIPGAGTSTVLAQLLESLDAAAAGLDLLTEQLGNLPGGDAVMRTAILDRISALYGDLNRLRAETRNRKKTLGSAESSAEFGAQFKLFGQSVENALEFADTPEKCDDALTRLLAQLEELEGRFAEQDEFLADIAAKRESLYEALSGRRQSLLEVRQRRAQGMVDAGTRILDGIARRVAQLNDLAQVHSYFAADPLLAKLRKIMEELRTMGAGVGADDLDTRLKTARDLAIRGVLDKKDLSSEDGLRLGRHVFTVSTQALDLTLIPRGDGLAFHLTGTDYFAPVADERLQAFRPWWDLALPSETQEIYRAEYLAGCLLRQALEGQGEFDWKALQAMLAAGPEERGPLLEWVRREAASRYREGYQKGVHDEDALSILSALVVMQSAAGLLAWGPKERSLALLYWQHGGFVAERESLQRRARAVLQMQQLFGAREGLERLESECAVALEKFALEFSAETDGAFGVPAAHLPLLAARAAAYLIHQLADSGGNAWAVSGAGEDLALALRRDLEHQGKLAEWQRDLEAALPAERWRLAGDWVGAYAASVAKDAAAWVDEAAAVLAVSVPRVRLNVDLERRLEGFLGDHPRLQQGGLRLNLNEFWQRFDNHVRTVVPGYAGLQSLRQELVAGEKARLRLEQFQAKPLASFVRNRLIDEVYLPIVGDNLAKQIGTVGAGNRTDRMGMLLLISPPGYGKTTLMEYIADRLGLVFVRINCPALGHGITDLDPANARHGAARQELEKLNLGLAMGNNVMLYLDDIQHTHPEFLQKFIALADGTRRIEGVWNGETRSYDLRGKRFAVVMAGNPYTESGDVFKIPDMLANRADIYNLGDVLSGRESLFSLSYIENSLTSNPVLQPLAARDPKDIHLLVRLAEGEEIPSSVFVHGYSAVELEELKALLQRLFKARNLLLQVNLAYIASAAQQDAYRSEPPFKLQGSYRNMNKLAAKVTPLMRDDELDALLRDHYRGEAQTLTIGAEENLLKLAELIGSASAEEAKRWQEIKDEFVRRRKLGGDDADGSTRIANTLLDVARAVDALKADDALADRLSAGLAQLDESLRQLKPTIEVAPADVSQFVGVVEGMTQSYEKVLLPLVSATYHKLKMDHSIWDEMKRVSGYLNKLEKLENSPTEAAPPATKKGKS